MRDIHASSIVASDCHGGDLYPDGIKRYARG